MFPRLVGLAVALGVTLMIFFGAGYFGAVWSHYFSSEPPKNTGVVTVNIISGGKPPCPPGKRC
jgi:hypothetical protein